MTFLCWRDRKSGSRGRWFRCSGRRRRGSWARECGRGWDRRLDRDAKNAGEGDRGWLIRYGSTCSSDSPTLRVALSCDQRLSRRPQQPCISGARLRGDPDRPSETGCSRRASWELASSPPPPHSYSLGVTAGSPTHPPRGSLCCEVHQDT